MPRLQGRTQSDEIAVEKLVQARLATHLAVIGDDPSDTEQDGAGAWHDETEDDAVCKGDGAGVHDDLAIAMLPLVHLLLVRSCTCLDATRSGLRQEAHLQLKMPRTRTSSSDHAGSPDLTECRSSGPLASPLLADEGLTSSGAGG